MKQEKEYCVVKFTNGYYGIKVKDNEYFDFSNPKFSWSKTSNYFEDCQVKEKTARRMLDLLTIPDEVIICKKVR